MKLTGTDFSMGQFTRHTGVTRQGLLLEKSPPGVIEFPGRETISWDIIAGLFDKVYPTHVIESPSRDIIAPIVEASNMMSAME